MPDADFTSETLPEKTGATPPTDDQITTGISSPETSIGEKIRKAGDAVFSKIGIVRKRGRPKNCAGCGQPETRCACAAAPAPAPAPAPGDKSAAVADPVPPPVVPVAVVDNSLLTGAIISAVKGTLGFLKDLCRKKIKQADLDTTTMSKALEETNPDPESLKGFSDALEAVMKKRNVNTEYAPEIALGIYSVRLASPFVMLLTTLNAEISRKRKLELQKGGAK